MNEPILGQDTIVRRKLTIAGAKGGILPELISFVTSRRKEVGEYFDYAQGRLQLVGIVVMGFST